MIIYHNEDMDGVASGALLREAYPDETFVGMGYSGSSSLPEIREGERVIFADYSLKPWSRMEDVAAKAGDMVVIDHHVTTKRHMSTDDEGITFVVDMDKSGCELTWQWLNPDKRSGEMPTALRWIADYDLWRSEGQDWEDITLPFRYGLKTRIKEGIDDFLWCRLFVEPCISDTLHRIMEEGASVVRYLDGRHQRELDEMSHLVEIDGHDALAVNGTCEHNMSLFDTADADVEMYLSYHWTGETWSVTMWSSEIDVSKIAERHGGGGHEGAAGFSCSVLPWRNAWESLKSWLRSRIF